jgi:hypothetical protein
MSEVENLPYPPPEVLVVFSAGGHLDTRAINSPSVKIDVITNFDYPKGDPGYPGGGYPKGDLISSASATARSSFLA